ncbi:DUF4908 domain-containing protein [Phenylobacterium sp.]|uniref:DUF4908 domain-containing protein n=1 Tax=Phenylobacterium sp. TaxID=1871053 RepID=UPI0025CEF1CF|nr:DUF4908 domain-containing protein [Phenylobacterium sp.]
MVAALLGAVALGAPAAADAGPVDRLRDSLARRSGGQVAGPPVARFVSEEGRVFVLDRTQPTPMLKFEDSPEVWVLAPSPAPRGDVIYKDELGEPVLRATRLGGLTLFSDERPNGEAVSLAGGGFPLRLAPLSPGALGERLLQASYRSGRVARRTIVFEARRVTPAGSALVGDAALVTSLAFIRMAAERRGGRSVFGQFNIVRFEEGKKPTVTLKDGVLRIVVAPSQGLAGRPSSKRIMQVAAGR